MLSFVVVDDADEKETVETKLQEFCKMVNSMAVICKFDEPERMIKAFKDTSVDKNNMKSFVKHINQIVVIDS